MQLAGGANYGYCASHSRFYWGLKLYLITTLDEMPIVWCLGCCPGSCSPVPESGWSWPACPVWWGLVLPPATWARGPSMINTARQVGTVLGTAVVVVIRGATPDLDAFRRGWIFVGAAALASALAGCAIAGRRNSTDAYRPPAAVGAGRPTRR